MDSFEWNKIFGGVLAGAVAVLAVSIASDEMFARHMPAKPGYVVAGAEEAPAAGAVVEAEKPAAFYLASADVAKGEAVFKKCAACHNAAPAGANGTESVSFLAYRQTIARLEIGLGSAVSVLLFIVVVMIAMAFIKGFKVDLSAARGE